MCQCLRFSNAKSMWLLEDLPLSGTKMHVASGDPWQAQAAKHCRWTCLRWNRCGPNGKGVVGGCQVMVKNTLSVEVDGRYIYIYMYIWCDIWWFWHVKGQFVWTLKLIYLCKWDWSALQLEIFTCGWCTHILSTWIWNWMIGHWHVSMDLLIFLSFFDNSFLLFITSFWPSFSEGFLVAWHCTTLQCAKAEDIPDIKRGNIGKDQSCFAFSKLFLCLMFTIFTVTPNVIFVNVLFFSNYYMYTIDLESLDIVYF